MSNLRRAAVLAWHDRWSDADRATIREELERVDAATFETIPSDNYIKVLDGDGELVLHLNRGYLDFLPGKGPRHAQVANNGWSYLPLTCHRLRPSANTIPTLVGQLDTASVSV